MSDRADTFTAMRKHRYHPWRRLARRAGVRVHFTDDLPTGVDGETDGRTIWIRKGLTQAQRRSVLAHELAHIERGIDYHPAFEAREEEAVERLAARRLIDFEHLADVLVWHRGRVDHAVANDLWVDLQSLEARIRALTEDERAELRRRFDLLEETA